MNITAGNQITLLKNGTEFFPALIAAIDAAAVDICIETYIFRDDASGTSIAKALARAVVRGVAVKVLIDGVGSKSTPPVFFDAMRDAGISLMVFRPDHRLFHFRKTRLHRNHRKIALVDGKVGFVGGLNLIDDMTDSLSEHPRLDYAVKIEGPLLTNIYKSVHQLWQWVALQHFRRKLAVEPALPMEPAPAGNHRALFVVRDNFRHRHAIEALYRQAITRAQSSVLIVCAYFLPGRRLRRRLIEAAERGVQVTLLLQGRADHPLLQMATRALYAQLLGANITICEYQKSMLHAKVAVIDDAWATVGSSNLDPFSLFLNREANVAVFDGDFARQLRESVMAELDAGAITCKVEDWHKRSLSARAQSWFAYGLARWVAGLIGVSKRWE
ncbi:MAG: cardiolipin synthase ClsB [Betaproteobacteria bacterium]|nr:cardiolipin synthase ClsB [Betaproteobacteria bacterium]